MTTLYVAGPMTGLPEFNYPEFRSAAAQLRAAGYDVLNPIDVDVAGVPEAELTWEWYMRRTIVMVVASDGIATLPGWRDSKGARIEVELAERIGIGEAPLSHWLAYPTEETP